MSEATYTLSGTAVLAYYIEQKKHPYMHVSSSTTLALQKFSIDEIKRVSDTVVLVKGTLLVLVRLAKGSEPSEIEMTIPILYNEYAKGSKQPIDSNDFEQQLNAFTDEKREIAPNMYAVTGKDAYSLWEDYQTYKQNMSPDDDEKYPDVPKMIRMDIELMLKKYSNNKAFKERYDNFFTRFYMLAQELASEHPDEVKLTLYKGMPILYLKDDELFQQDVRITLYMTPMALYRVNMHGYVGKHYDLSTTKIFYGMDSMTKISKNYIICPERLNDLFYILDNLDSRGTLTPKEVKPPENKTFFGIKMPKLFGK